MAHSSRLHRARSLFEDVIRAETGESDAAILSESVLIRDDFYCGRILRSASHKGVWFIEQDELKVYREGGQWLQTIDCAAAETATEPAILKLPEPTKGDSNGEDSGDLTRRAA